MKTGPSGRQLLPNLDVSHFKTGDGNGFRATGGLQQGKVSLRRLGMFGIRGKFEDDFFLGLLYNV